MLKKFFISFFIAILTIESFAEETANLEDDLFGDESETILSQEETKSENISETLKLKSDLNNGGFSLENQKLKIGGSLNSGLNLSFKWLDPYSKKDDYTKSFLDNKRSLDTILGANLFFDARPVENLKLYGKFLFGVPFEKTVDGEGVMPTSTGKPSTIPVQTNGIPNIKIQELYTDFSVKDIAFFRFGKHAVKWGVGYFYQPSDVLNISRIDPEHPTEDREGPLSLRTHIIIPKTQINLWFYLLPDMEKFLPEYTAFATKAEFLLGDWELGIGGWYRYEKAPRAIATLTGSIAGKVGVFAEGVFAWGSDYRYHKNDVALTTYEQKNKPFFQATIGGSYSIEKTHTSFTAQYFYNGFGYTHKNDVQGIILSKLQKNDKDAIALVASQNISTMGNSGQHYIAFSISQSKIGTEKLSANLLQQFGVSERSASTMLNVNWNIIQFVSMNTGLAFSYPLSLESSNKGSITYMLGFKLGGGKF